MFDRNAAWLSVKLLYYLPAEAIQDVLQETFIAIWHGASLYRAEGEPSAWIWGVARNQAFQWVRKNNKRVPMLNPGIAEDPSGTTISRIDLKQAFISLGPKGSEQRELARLVFVEDRPLAEVGSILGIPEGTVKSRVYKVRCMLKATLRKGGYGLD